MYRVAYNRTTGPLPVDAAGVRIGGRSFAAVDDHQAAAGTAEGAGLLTYVDPGKDPADEVVVALADAERLEARRRELVDGAKPTELDALAERFRVPAGHTPTITAGMLARFNAGDVDDALAELRSAEEPAE